MKARVGLTILAIIGGLLLAGCSGMNPIKDFTSQNAVETSDYNSSNNRDDKAPWHHGSWD
jgi:outer membrane murein-binding lipoprotein Lpp